MKRSEQKVYRLTAPQWRALTGVAKAHPRPSSIVDQSTRKALIARELVAPVADRRWDVMLTDLGQRVYARLSVGDFCCRCSKPLTFEKRTMVPNVSPAKWECTTCARRAA